MWLADPGQVVLSWRGAFASSAPIPPGARRPGCGSLRLLPRADGKPGWVLADEHGVVLTRMSARFQFAGGRHPPCASPPSWCATPRMGEAGLHCDQWELVPAEIEYQPAGG